MNAVYGMVAAHRKKYTVQIHELFGPNRQPDGYTEGTYSHSWDLCGFKQSHETGVTMEYRQTLEKECKVRCVRRLQRLGVIYEMTVSILITLYQL